MSKNNHPRWTRIESLTTEEQKRLDILCNNTSGMPGYGNRVRTAVMLQIDLAEKVAAMMAFSEQSASSVIGELIEYAINSIDSRTEELLVEKS